MWELGKATSIDIITFNILGNLGIQSFKLVASINHQLLFISHALEYESCTNFDFPGKIHLWYM